MKRLIILTGDLASGKSTYATKLSKTFNIMQLHKDDVKETLGDTIGFHNREENLKLSIASIEIMKNIFKEMTNYNYDLILEANFHKHELEDIKTNAKNKGYKVLVLLFEADIDILYKRYLYRMNNENRNPVHLTSRMDEYDIFKEYIIRSRNDVVIEGEIIQIDASNFNYQNDSKLLEKIQSFLFNEEVTYE